MKKRTIKPKDLRKYKINECLLKMPMDEHREAVRRIPKMIRISLNTFHNYRNILIDDPQDIPHEKVVRFEIFFDLKTGELLNKTIKGIAFKEILGKNLNGDQFDKDNR